MSNNKKHDILVEYINNNYKNLRQFTAAYGLDYGNLYRAIKSKNGVGAVLAEKINNLIYNKTGKFIFLDTLDVNKSINASVIEFLNLPDSYTIDNHNLAAVGVNRENLKMFKINDDSMSPIFYKDSLILVDISDNEIILGKFYAISINGEMAIRRIIKKIGSDSYTAKPENINFESQPFDLNHDELIGRCVHICGQNI